MGTRCFSIIQGPKHDSSKPLIQKTAVETLINADERRFKGEPQNFFHPKGEDAFFTYSF
jgi:hypothetical protein